MTTEQLEDHVGTMVVADRNFEPERHGHTWTHGPLQDHYMSESHRWKVGGYYVRPESIRPLTVMAAIKLGLFRYLSKYERVKQGDRE